MKILSNIDLSNNEINNNSPLSLTGGGTGSSSLGQEIGVVTYNNNGNSLEILDVWSKGFLYSEGNGRSTPTWKDIPIVDIIYPVGSVIMSASDAFDPNEYFSGTSWERYAQGLFLVGVDLSTTAYNMANKQGGLKYHHHTIDHTHNIPSVLLEPKNIPAHTHQFVNGDTGIHFVGYDFRESGVGKINIYAGSGGSAKYTTYAASAPNMWGSLYDSATTGSQPQSAISSVAIGPTLAPDTSVTGITTNIPPYCTIHCWQRTS